MDVIRTLPTQRGNPWLFIGKKQGMPLNNPVKAFQRIVRRAGIFDKEVCIHTCRHSVAALIVSYGGTLYDVQAQLGHRSSQSSQRYAHLHPQRLQNTSQLLWKAITAQLPPCDNRKAEANAPAFLHTIRTQLKCYSEETIVLSGRKRLQHHCSEHVFCNALYFPAQDNFWHKDFSYLC
jgi:hypothetical protein